jgi:hypothetical protein
MGVSGEVNTPCSKIKERCSDTERQIRFQEKEWEVVNNCDMKFWWATEEYTQGFDPWQKQSTFLLASASRPALRTTQSLPNGYRGSFPAGKARPGRDADYSSPSRADIKNGYVL